MSEPIIIDGRYTSSYLADAPRRTTPSGSKEMSYCLLTPDLRPSSNKQMCRDLLHCTAIFSKYGLNPSNRYDSLCSIAATSPHIYLVIPELEGDEEVKMLTLIKEAEVIAGITKEVTCREGVYEDVQRKRRYGKVSVLLLSDQWLEYPIRFSLLTLLVRNCYLKDIETFEDFVNTAAEMFRETGADLYEQIPLSLFSNEVFSNVLKNPKEYEIVTEELIRETHPRYSYDEAGDRYQLAESSGFYEVLASKYR